MWLGCIIHHVGLHVQQLFCTTAATTTWIHTIGKAKYNATVLILPLSIQCTLSLHTCNLIFTMTSLTIKIDFLPLLLLIIAVCKQSWASYCQNVIHYILVVAVKVISYITILLSLNSNGLHYFCQNNHRNMTRHSEVYCSSLYNQRWAMGHSIIAVWAPKATNSLL